MKLHEKIAVYRKKCGLSQETLAEKIGVSRQAVSKWETGDALPEITKLKSLAECFGVTVDFLLDENTDEVISEIDSFDEKFNTLKLKSLLSGEFDNNSAYVEIHSGAGGTESNDWADMLYRMYSRFFEKNGYKVHVMR